MELSPLIWQLIRISDVGSCLTVRLVRNGSSWSSPITDQSFLVCGVDAAAGLQAVFHCWKIQHVDDDGTVRLVSTPSSGFIQMPFHRADDYHYTAELCAGIGGTSLGALLAGHQPIAAMDRSKLACELLRRNGHTKVIQGDVECLGDILRFHQALEGKRAGLLAGFPCQPFSRLGSNRCFQDPRAKVFFRIIDAAALLDVSFMLLECVSQAGEQELIKGALDMFCAKMEFQWQAVNLHLDRTLPTYRTRWWALLIPKEMEMPKLLDLPFCEGRQQLGQLIPSWPTWSTPEERALALDDHEKDFYLSERPNNGQRFLDLSKKSPTILHSLAHHRLPCPCGCRDAFQESTLQSGGIHGILIRTAESSTGLRHPHPMELSLLNGIPHGLVCNDSLKELLPMIGQIASPVQAHWVLVQWQAVNVSNEEKSMGQRHEDLINMIIRSHKQNWPTPEMFVPRPLQVVIEKEPPMIVTLCRPTRVHQVVQATRDLLDEMTVSWASPHPPHADPLIDPSSTSLMLRYGSGATLDWRDLVAAPMTIPRGLHEITLRTQGQIIFDHDHRENMAFLTPQMMAHALERSLSKSFLINCMDGAEKVVALFWDQGHWLFLFGQKIGEQVHIDVYDGLDREISFDLHAMCGKLAQAFDCLEPKIYKKTIVRQKHGDHCGTIALLHMGLVLNTWQIADEATAILWYEALRRKQLHHGTGPDREAALMQWLCNFLPSKGVAEADVEQRAKAAIRKLGIEPLEQSIKEKDAWRSLKALGNKLGKPFQWITVDELERHIQARAHHRFGTDTKMRKKGHKARKTDTEVTLTPELLELLPDSFEDEDGDPLQMVTLDNVRPDMRGHHQH